MESLFSQLFLQIQNHILLTVPEIAYIDQDLGQMDYFETRPSFDWPALLLDFDNVETSDHMHNVQWVALNIVAKLCFNPFSTPTSVVPDISQEESMKFYEIEHKLYKALQSFTANNLVQPLTRVSINTQEREDAFRVRLTTFTTATEDETLYNSVKVNATARIETEGLAATELPGKPGKFSFKIS